MLASLGRRGWVYLTAALLSIPVFWTALASEPVKARLKGLQSPSKGKPATSITPATPFINTSSDGLENVLGPLREYEDGFTIVSPTYHRTESLPEYLDNYATGEIPSLKRIVLIWNNEEDPTADFNKTLTKYTVPVVVERRARNSKNERFRRTPSITTAAVLALDDDMVYIPRDVEYGFQEWQNYRYPRVRMVGYVRRRVDRLGNYRMQPDPDGYSMVLTKCAFMHVDWFDLWWADTQLMRDFRDYVDSRKLPEQYPDLMTGCEDIAMAFLVGNSTHTPPLWVEGATFHDIGHSKLDGISTQNGHNDARQACVHHFIKVFGKDAQPHTQIHATLIAPAEGSGRQEEWN